VFKKQVAAREQVKLMIGLTGPSGAGKTYSALQLAYGITGDWTKIALADTENRSALYYAGSKTGPWDHIDFPSTMPQGYHPNNWVNLISFVESDPKIEVLILDSISHEWQGTGGCLQLVESLKAGFASWKTVTPLHTKFIDRMRQSRLHIIATMRSSQDYVVEQNDKGKATPKKVGLKANQREGTDYEFGIVFDVDISHYASSSKDRTGLFAERGPFVITSDVGRELLSWSREGKSKHPIFDKSRKELLEHLGKKYEELNYPDGYCNQLAEALDGQEYTLANMQKHMDTILASVEAVTLDEAVSDI
jgi:hypothetical protein